MTSKQAIIIAFLSAPLPIQSSARADPTKVILTVRDGTFSPDLITGPADSKFILLITNEGSEAEEFESAQLNREKVIAPGKTITVFLGPLKSGRYEFFGDFHPKTAKGVLIVK